MSVRPSVRPSVHKKFPYSGLLKDRDFLLISNVEVRAVSLEVVT